MNQTRPLPDIDSLDRAIVRLSACINAASYELLVLVRRFDERAGWLKWGFTNCAEWLHWRCDLSVGAAREKVRVEERCRELRCGTADSVSDANRAHARRSLHISRDPNHGTMTVTVELPLGPAARVGEADCLRQ